MISFHRPHLINKGDAARFEYSDEDDCLVGYIAGINDVVGFHANSVAELHTAFKEAVVIYFLMPADYYIGFFTLDLSFGRN